MGTTPDDAVTGFEIFAIHSANERGFWNNDDGWVFALADATTFTYSEALSVNLPNSDGMDAEWFIVDYVH